MVFPSGSVAVARKVLVLSGATVTCRPGELSAAAEPVAAGVPEQSAVGYRFTVDPGSAVPWITGVVLGFGEAGVTWLSTTDAGGVESFV